MSVTPNYVPREYKTINPILIVKDVNKALKFYNDAFGAETTMKLDLPDGKIFHAEMKIEDMIIMLEEESVTNTGVSSAVFKFYTGDVEGMFEAALKAGASEVMPIKEQFYGERVGKVKDPFGNQWLIATHEENFSFSEIKKRFDELYS